MSEAKIGKQPPHNLNAEKSVLGAMMLSPVSVAMAIERLKEEDFYLLPHQKIFQAMHILHMHAKNVDLVTVGDELDKMGVLENVGGYSYLTDLSDYVPVLTNIHEYVNIVRNDSLLRQLIDISGRITDDCFNDEKSTYDIISGAEKMIFDLSQSEDKKKFVHVKETANEVIKNVEFRYSNPDAITGIRTGFSSLDTLLTGLHGGELVLIAARPGMGKSAFALNIAQQSAMLDKTKAAVFTLEMPSEQLVERLMSSLGDLELTKIKTGALSDKDWDKISEAADELGQCDIYIDDTSGINIPEIFSKCRRLKAEFGLGMVVIDYLQLLSSFGRKESRLQEISEMTRMLKIMSMDLDVPVLLLSQLSRAPEQRQNHRPMLSDLRESGSIEQDADVVIFLYRDDYYMQEGSDINPDAVANEAEIIVAKHRSGPTGTIKLVWHGDTVRFVDVDNRHTYM
ncbi:MAG: replicative DNA helicase [Eubacteriales bacterium]